MSRPDAVPAWIIEDLRRRGEREERPRLELPVPPGREDPREDERPRSTVIVIELSG